MSTELTFDELEGVLADQGISVSARGALKNLNDCLERWTEDWITQFIALERHRQMLQAKGKLRAMIELHDALSGLVEESDGDEEDNAVEYLRYQMKWNALRNIISSSGEESNLIENQSYLASLREIPEWIA